MADVVPLHGENRILVRSGLAQLRRSQCVGFKAMLEVSGLAAKADLVAMDIGYGLGPRASSTPPADSAVLAWPSNC